MEPTRQGSLYPPVLSRQRDANTPLSFGLHLGEELFPLGFAPDISHGTLATMLQEVYPPYFQGMAARAGLEPALT